MLALWNELLTPAALVESGRSRTGSAGTTTTPVGPTSCLIGSSRWWAICQCDGRQPSAISRVYQAFESLEEAGILLPLTRKRRNQSWEADGLLSLLEGLEAGERPRPVL
jgi:hypothetical protein